MSSASSSLQRGLSSSSAASSSTAAGRSRFTISSAPSYLSAKQPGTTRPAHHANDSKTLFTNPWPSFREPSTMELLRMFRGQSKASPLPPAEEIKRLIPVRPPTWGVETQDLDGIKATWLGHASFLIEFPAAKGASRGLRVLTDPVLSNRCSPSQWMGPARFTPAPCTADEIPDFDVLVLSHNHYDHLDITTLKAIAKRPNRPHVFLPLNTIRCMSGTGFERSDMTELDWWETADLSVMVGEETEPTVLTVTGTPAQHFTSRTPFDKGASLWNSFALYVPSIGPAGSAPTSVLFAGDTGYSALPDEAPRSSPTPADYRPDRAVCPAFKEIGAHFGGFDLALIPIGAYEPRGFMSAVHMDPFEAVRYFQDVKAKQAIGMHWGVWRLTTEPIDEPPRLLADARNQAGISESDFHCMGIGETRMYMLEDRR